MKISGKDRSGFAKASPGRRRKNRPHAYNITKQYEDDKYGILDVRVKLKNGVQIDFEMQVVYYDYWLTGRVLSWKNVCGSDQRRRQL